MKRRILACLLAVAMLLSILPISAFAANTVASGTCGDNLTWTLDSDGVLTISGTGQMDNYTSVNSFVNTPWFDRCTSIKKVIIENGVTSLGEWAFSHCINMTEITIPDSVTSICRSALYKSNSLTAINIPNSVTSIGNWALYQCGLTDVVIPDGVISIGENAFWDSEKLTSITVPKSVTSIGDDAFTLCDRLTGIWVNENNRYYSSDEYGVLFNKEKTELLQAPTLFKDSNSGVDIYSYVIPDSVTTIRTSAFQGCSYLTAIAIPDSVTSIGSYAFASCRRLTHISIPYGVTQIGRGTFSICARLTDITIPESVASISYSAFSACSGLASITFVGDAPEISKDAFGQVTANAYYPANNPTWTSDVMQDYGGTLTWEAADTPALAAPAKNKIVNIVSGIHVYWKEVADATSYTLYRSTSLDGAYTAIKSGLKATHYTDTAVTSGKTYYYKVIAKNAEITSPTSEAQSITYVGTPDITSRVNKAAGVVLGWDKIAGATGYAIYRKSYDGNDAWVRVATISGNSTFTWTDTSVKNNNGTVYRYTVRALAGSNMKTLSGCRSTGRTMVRLSSQVLSSVTKASATSALCKWTTSKAVTGYEVRFMVDGVVYKTFTIGNYKTGVKTFTGLPSGKTYTVQVRTYKKVDGVGSFYSAWSIAKTVTLK